MHRLFFFFFLLATFFSEAQTVKGRVLDEAEQPVAFATISLLSLKDSLPQKLAVAKADGTFSIVISKEATYLLSATHIGFTKVYTKAITLMAGSDADVKIYLAKEPASLKSITVTTNRPLLEVKGDRMIVNIEGTVNNIGTTALEVLRKSPGVMVDSDDNISMSGKTGVFIFIDGRQSPLTGADLSVYLQSLQSGQLESIEIISNPSAKYEAAGNGGIINIRLKRNKAFGTNGSMSAGYGIGTFAKYNGSFSINHRNRRLNIFGTYTYAHNRNLVTTDTYRALADSIFDQQAQRVITDRPHNIQVGLDVFINPKSTIGILANAVPGQLLIDNTSTTAIMHKNSNVAYRRLDAKGVADNQRKNNSLNVNYRFAADGRELNVDADYAHYNNVNDQYQPNFYFDNNSTLLFSRIYHMVSPSDITMYAAKGNYDFNRGGGQWSIGGKYSTIESINDLKRFNVTAATEKMDSLRSNAFTYRENIAAGFARYTKTYKKISWQMGLRAEATHVDGASNAYRWNGHYIPYDSLFQKSYIDLFPSLFITYKKDKNHHWSLNAGRRIDRPAYADLNPFEFRVDEYVYRRGNTQLRPQYTNQVEVVHLYKNKFTTIFNYSHVKDVFTQIFDTVEQTKSFITKTNVATQDIANLILNYSFQKGRYSGFVNLNPFYNRYRSNFGKDRNLNLEAFSCIVKSQQAYKFKGGLVGELSLLYNSPGIGLGFFKGPGFGSVDVALAKTFLQNRMSLKAAMSDLFFTNQLKGTSFFAGQYMQVNRTFEPRLFRLNVTYRFGSSTVKAARQRKTLLEEENKRLQSSN